MERRPRHRLRWPVLLLGTVALLAACGNDDSGGTDLDPADASIEVSVPSAGGVESPSADEDATEDTAADASGSEAEPFEPSDDVSTSTESSAELADAPSSAESSAEQADAPSSADDTASGSVDSAGDTDIADPAPATTAAPPVTTTASTTTQPAPSPDPEPAPPSGSGTGISVEEIARIEAQLDEIDRLLADLEASLATD